MQSHTLPVVCVVAAALLLTSSCSRDKPATPVATTPAPAATPATSAPAAPAATPKEVVFGVEELDQMVAPIALYPDPLLAQVLMAATYPGDIAEAAAWSKANPDAKGDAAVKQVASQPWDPSVQSLVAFPQALVTLGQDPVWVQRLGDAFLAQPDDVMDAIQRLRRKAQTAGNLESNQYQNVTVQPAVAPAPAVGGIDSTPAPVSETIIIESADPQTVYVPSYDPNIAYGSWDYPSYPPTYYPPSPYYYPLGGALATGLMWGTGLAIAGSLWGDLDWGNNDIDIDVDNYNSINSNRQIDRSQSNWSHNAANRDGVPYRDRANREANNRRLDGAAGRSEFRGEDANRARSREQARASMEKRGVDAPARSNQEARDRAQAASRDRAQAGSRDQARDRAQATTRDRAQADRSRAQAGSRDAARDRAQASSQRQQQANRDQARRTQDATRHRQSQSNTQARSAARNQQQSRQSPRNDAFQGASRPQQSRASAQRGRSSHASAQRGGSSRGGGQPAQRQSRQPQQRQSARR